MLPLLANKECAPPQEEEEEVYGSEDGSYRERKNKFGWDATNYKDPAELDATASAAEIVQAWAFRLKGTLVSPFMWRIFPVRGGLSTELIALICLLFFCRDLRPVQSH